MRGEARQAAFGLAVLALVILGGLALPGIETMLSDWFGALLHRLSPLVEDGGILRPSW